MEEGLDKVIPSITQVKDPAMVVMVTHITNRDGSRFMTYTQRIRAYLLLSEVVDLLITDPNGYDNMLLKDKSRGCINGNGEDTLCQEKCDVSGSDMLR
jgi:hypothetical protein